MRLLLAFPLHPFAYFLTLGICLELPITRIFSISLEGSSYRESTVIVLLLIQENFLVLEKLTFSKALFKILTYPFLAWFQERCFSFLKIVLLKKKKIDNVNRAICFAHAIDLFTDTAAILN